MPAGLTNPSGGPNIIAQPVEAVMERIEVVLTDVNSTSLGTTAAKTVAAPNTDRRSLFITNCDAANIVYIGFSNAVTSSCFFRKLVAGDWCEIAVSGWVDVWMIASGASTKVQVVEVG